MAIIPPITTLTLTLTNSPPAAAVISTITKKIGDRSKAKLNIWRAPRPSAEEIAARNLYIKEEPFKAQKQLNICPKCHELGRPVHRRSRTDKNGRHPFFYEHSLKIILLIDPKTNEPVWGRHVYRECKIGKYASLNAELARAMQQEKQRQQQEEID